MQKPISGELAEKIYDILVETCGAHKMGRDQFIRWATDDSPGNEYRFGGVFGMAGKIWLEYDRVRVSGPNDQELKEAHNPDEQQAALKAATEKLAEF